MKKIIRITTVPSSLKILLKGQLKYLSQYFEVIGISSKGEDLKNVEDDEGVKTCSVEMARKISPFKDLIAVIRLYFIFKKEKPLIVHSITPKAGLLTMLAGKMAGIPIRMHTFTGLIFPTRTGFMQKLLIKMDQLLCWSATNIYPEGKGVQNDLIKFKITGKPLKVIANGNVNGIDLDHYVEDKINIVFRNNLKKELNIIENNFVFIFVGRLVGDKGINELIRAYSAIRTINTKLLLVGSYEEDLDPLDKETLKMIDAYDDIISVGFQKDVRPYFLISNALVFPSYREGFPNVVMQAGAMGLPSVVSNINGCNEIIIPNENGLIVPSKNIEQLKEAMQLMMNDKEKYSRMKSNARKMIRDRYDQEVVWVALLHEYKTLLKEKNINADV